MCFYCYFLFYIFDLYILFYFLFLLFLPVLNTQKVRSKLKSSDRGRSNAMNELSSVSRLHEQGSCTSSAQNCGVCIAN